MDPLRPSVAALLVPRHDGAALEQLVTRAMTRQRYVRHDAGLPRGYEPAGDEWIAVALDVVGTPQAPVGLILPEAVDQVFQLALWVSAALGDHPLVAWRAFMGLPAVWKLFVDGVPRWKDGDDHDLEVDFPVPRDPPIDVVDPAAVGLPVGAGSVPLELGPKLRPYRAAVAAGAPRSGWLERRSRLVG